MRVLWTLGAQEDARDLALALHALSPTAARRLAEDLALAAERLSDLPRLGKPAGADRHFSLLVARGRYRLIYRIDATGDRVLILGVSRAARPWPATRP